MTDLHRHPAPARTGRNRPVVLLDRTLLAAAAWSGLHVLVALRWLLDPDSWPWNGGGDFGLLPLLPPRVGSAAVLAAAGAGLLLALTARQRGPSTGLVVATAAEAALLAALSADIGALVLLGYLCAIVGPAAFLAAFTAGAVHDRRRRPWLLAVLALGAVGLASGVLRPTTVGELARDLVAGFADRGLPPAHLALLLAGAGLWAAVAVLLRRATTGRCGVCGRPAARWTEPDAALRWGRVATWIAAAGPLPYALVRMTWLTPWELGVPQGEDVDASMRLFGLALGAAALGGAVLTAGLVRPWGETWPGWVPGLRGRPVPLRVPVVAGGLVAVALLAASPGLLAHGIGGLLSGDRTAAAFLVVFPTLPWGLALAAAVAGYAYRRRGACAVCGRGAPAVSVRR